MIGTPCEPFLNSNRDGDEHQVQTNIHTPGITRNSERKQVSDLPSEQCTHKSYCVRLTLYKNTSTCLNIEYHEYFLMKVALYSDKNNLIIMYV